MPRYGGVTTLQKLFAALALLPTKMVQPSSCGTRRKKRFAPMYFSKLRAFSTSPVNVTVLGCASLAGFDLLRSIRRHKRGLHRSGQARDPRLQRVKIRYRRRGTWAYSGVGSALKLASDLIIEANEIQEDRNQRSRTGVIFLFPIPCRCRCRCS